MAKPSDLATTYGIDIGKNGFHLVALDGKGAIVQRARLSRTTVFKFFAAARPALVGMEACPGSQWLARKLIELGHDARIMPARFVKPFVKSNKNDTLDAEAIAEAVRRPTMRFIQIRRPEQIDLQALHRVRSRIVANRTAPSNQIRAFCLEYGIAMRKGAGVLKIDVAAALENEANELTIAMRSLVASLMDDYRALERRIQSLDHEIERLARSDAVANRLTTIPGIGPLGATALIAAVGDGKQFKRARDLAAWLGLVPRQNSTGGRSILLGISKRGNPYVRRLLIHGARSCLLHLDRDQHALGPVAEPAGPAGPSQQGGRRAREQDCQDGVGRLDPTRRALPQGQRRRGGLTKPQRIDRTACGAEPDDETALRRRVNLAQKTEPSSSCQYSGTRRADLITAWLENQPARERPDTLLQSQFAHHLQPCEAGRTIHFSQQILERRIVQMRLRQKAAFSRLFSASSWRSRLASLTAMPPNLAFQR
jgi:transposase